MAVNIHRPTQSSALVLAGPYEIELVPSTSWGKSLAKLARAPNSGFRPIWDRIRKREISRADGKCEYCGATNRGLLLHEEWIYDTHSLTQNLSGYKVSCEDCNLILHAGRTSALGRVAEAKAHFEKVTGLDAERLATAVVQAMSDWRERSRHTWHINVSLEPLAKGFEDPVNRLT